MRGAPHGLNILRIKVSFNARIRLDAFELLCRASTQVRSNFIQHAIALDAAVQH